MPTLTVITEQCLAPVPGGTGRYAQELALALASGAPDGWAVRGLTAWHRDVRPATGPGMPPTRRLPVGRRVLAALWERGLPPAVGGSIVHATTPLAPLGAAQRSPVVVTVHDAVPWTHPETLTPRGVAWHRRMIERAARSAAAVVVPTAAVAADLEHHARLSRNVHVVGEGISERFRHPVPAAESAAARDRLGLPAEYAVIVGTLEPRKGLDVALDAMVLLPGRHLAVVGPPGWGGLDVHSEIARRGLAARVHVTGRLADRELAAVVAGARVSVTASRAEGFCLPMLEAMALGVPVVRTAIPVLDEVSGGTGIAVPPGEPAPLAEAIGHLMDNPGVAADFAVRGRRRAAEFTWERVAAELWTLYRSRLER